MKISCIKIKFKSFEFKQPTYIKNMTTKKQKWHILLEIKISKANYLEERDIIEKKNKIEIPSL